MGIMSKINYANQPDDFYVAQRMMQAVVQSKAVASALAGLAPGASKDEIARVREDVDDKSVLAMASVSRAKLEPSLAAQEIGTALRKIRIVCQKSSASGLCRATLQKGNGKVLASSDPMSEAKIITAKRQLMKRVKVAGA